MSALLTAYGLILSAVHVLTAAWMPGWQPGWRQRRLETWVLVVLDVVATWGLVFLVTAGASAWFLLPQLVGSLLVLLVWGWGLLSVRKARRSSSHPSGRP